MAGAELPIVYWDTAAILSSLFRDRHSDLAFEWARANGVHLMSSLAYAEAWAVMGRLRRERILADILIEAASEALHQGPWRRLHSEPDWKLVRSLAGKWPLRGADLWHLATARSLKAELTDLVLLTFDARLQEAAAGEGLVPRAQMIRRPHKDR